MTMSDSIVFGIHAVRRRLQQAPQQCLALVCLQNNNPRLRELFYLAEQGGVKLQL